MEASSLTQTLNIVFCFCPRWTQQCVFFVLFHLAPPQLLGMFFLSLQYKDTMYDVRCIRQLQTYNTLDFCEHWSNFPPKKLPDELVNTSPQHHLLTSMFNLTVMLDYFRFFFFLKKKTNGRLALVVWWWFLSDWCASVGEAQRVVPLPAASALLWGCRAEESYAQTEGE